MLRVRPCALILFLLLQPLLPLPACATRTKADSQPGLVIALADFSGQDRELGRFIADTLLTDLARSDKMRLVERAEIRQALVELKLQSTGLVAPEQFVRLGKLVSAGQLVVGGYLIRDGRMIINARLVDVRTGRLAPGISANVTGNPRDMLGLIHRLASEFHKRVTGTDLALDSDAPAAVSQAAPEAAESDALLPLRRAGLLPQGARPAGVVVERDLAAVVGQLVRRMGSRTERPLTSTRPDGAVERCRALAALVKLAVSPSELVSYASPQSDGPPDAGGAPLWSRPYVAAAMALGWWPSDRPIRARERATWAFLAAIVDRMPLDARPPTPTRPPARVVAEADPDAYTGLIVDARDLDLQRTMAPRIIDESGRVLYPDPAHIPTDDFLMDNGMASYCVDAGDATRAGPRPLMVRAAKSAGPGRDDVVIPRSAADRILEEEPRGRFLARWAVCFITGRR